MKAKLFVFFAAFAMLFAGIGTAQAQTYGSINQLNACRYLGTVHADSTGYYSMTARNYAVGFKVYGGSTGQAQLAIPFPGPNVWVTVVLSGPGVYRSTAFNTSSFRYCG